MKNPRVNIKRNLVCLYSKSMEMFEVVKMTKKGRVSKMYAPRFSFAPTFGEAMKSAGVVQAGFRQVVTRKAQASNWKGYAEMAWANALNK